MPRLLPFWGAKTKRRRLAGRVSTSLSWLALIGLVVLASGATSQAQVLPPPTIPATSAPRIVPGEIIVRFEPGISDEARDQSLAAVGAAYAGTVQLPQGGEAVIAQVPIGTEAASAESLVIDTNVLAAQPNVFPAPG